MRYHKKHKKHFSVLIFQVWMESLSCDHECHWRQASIMTEDQCNQVFLNGGPFFHLHTKPLEMDILFRSQENLDRALFFIALAVYYSGCRLLAFAIMNNHLHFILEGPLYCCQEFYEDFQRRLGVYLGRTGRANLAAQCEPGFTPISNLRQLRDEVAYVIRNPFVDREDVNLFAYRWCSGYLYFNDLMDTLFASAEPACKLSVTKRREYKCERNPEVDSRILMLNGITLPNSFVDFRRTESFFTSPRQFIHWVLKNVEGQVAIAKRMGETLALNDIELWSVSKRLVKQWGGTEDIKQLPPDTLTRVLKTLKYEYGASNAQIARCLRYPRSYIDELFPLSARGQ